MAEASRTDQTHARSHYAGPRIDRLKTALALFGFTLLAFAIHGYHYGIEDEAIYLPAIKKILDPSLYPRDSEFFMGQARGTALPWIIAALTRLTRAPLPWVVITTQFASISTFLAGCWMVASRCFPVRRQQWAGVALVTALLTLPIAGTSIYLADQHLHPRTLSCALVLMAISFALERRAMACIVACVGAALIHPLMAIYGIAFVVVLWLPRWRIWRRGWRAQPAMLFGAMAALPFLAHPTAAWREALATREYYTLRNWEWYEWLGLLAPMVVVWWLAKVAELQQLPTLANLLRRLNVYASVMCIVTLAVTIPRVTDFLWPLQPFRYLHTVYVLMIMAGAGLLARKRVWPVAAASVVLALVMCLVQLFQFDVFSGTPHVDCPGQAPSNAWVQVFLWARDNTPKGAYFALDPEYMHLSDAYGFRALAERSQMADISKDAGVVTVSPQLASEWKREVDAIRGWKEFGMPDFARLRRDFGVEWVIVTDAYHPPLGLDCPFAAPSHGSAGAAVCRTPAAPLPSMPASN